MMRPVERGNCPQDTAGNRIPFAQYRDARDHLIDRIGDYCSYCEVCLHSSIHVEHVRPKQPQPALERAWTNFLLACEEDHRADGAGSGPRASALQPARSALEEKVGRMGRGTSRA